MYQAFCGQKAQQNQPNTKKLKQQALMKDETYDVKKANSFEKFLEMKKGTTKEHLRQQIVLHFRSEDISFVEKHYLPQNTKHLKGKKRQKGNI